MDRTEFSTIFPIVPMIGRQGSAGARRRASLPHHAAASRTRSGKRMMSAHCRSSGKVPFQCGAL